MFLFCGLVWLAVVLALNPSSACLVINLCCGVSWLRFTVFLIVLELEVFGVGVCFVVVLVVGFLFAVLPPPPPPEVIEVLLVLADP